MNNFLSCSIPEPIVVDQNGNRTTYEEYLNEITNQIEAEAAARYSNK